MEILLAIAILILAFMLFDTRAKLRHGLKVLEKQHAESHQILYYKIKELEKKLKGNGVDTNEQSQHSTEGSLDTTASAKAQHQSKENRAITENVDVAERANYHAIAESRTSKQASTKRSLDLEKFIGENLINKIGIVALVLGVGLFVKFAIENDWVTEAGRVAIGIGTGLLLLAISHRIRKQYVAFSSVLTGGGLAVFYTTVYVAFHFYELMHGQQLLAFACMGAITILAVVLALYYCRQELAVIALLGGFVTPLLLNTGQGNYVQLFLYVGLLNGGMLALAFFRHWNIVRAVSYFGTVLLFGGWLWSEQTTGTQFSKSGAFVFASVYHLMFFLGNLAYSLRQHKNIKGLDMLMLISNAFLYFGAGVYLLGNGSVAVHGVFSGLLAVLYLALAYGFKRVPKYGQNVFNTLMGLGVALVGLVGFVLLHGHAIVLFWIMETALLLWLWKKTRLIILLWGHFAFLMLSGFSLLLNWNYTYFDEIQAGAFPVLLNMPFVTGMFFCVVLVVNIILLNKEEAMEWLAGLKIAALVDLLWWVAVFGVFGTLGFELLYQLEQYVGNSDYRDVVLASFGIGYLLVASKALASRFVGSVQALRLAALLMALSWYVAGGQKGFIVYRNAYLLGQEYNMLILWCSHYASLAIMLFFTVDAYRSTKTVKRAGHNPALWWIVAIALYLLSAELDHLYMLMEQPMADEFGRCLSKSHRLGYAVLWALMAFGLMVYGLVRKLKDFRLVSLALFGLTLVKLFVFDISNLPVAGKIISLIILSILLLVVSFMYQKLKTWLLDDPEEKQE